MVKTESHVVLSIRGCNADAAGRANAVKRDGRDCSAPAATIPRGPLRRARAAVVRHHDQLRIDVRAVMFLISVCCTTVSLDRPSDRRRHASKTDDVATSDNVVVVTTLMGVPSSCARDGAKLERVLDERAVGRLIGDDERLEGIRNRRR